MAATRHARASAAVVAILLSPLALADPPCSIVMDLVLVLDGSGSVTPYWGLVEQFAVQAIQSFNVSSAGVHVALTEFSSGDYARQ